MNRLINSKWIRRVAVFLAVGVCVAAFTLMAIGILGWVFRRDAAGRRDYVAYWASGQLFVRGANPYDARAILSVERSADDSPSTPVLVMRNPPTALPMVSPLGFLGEWPGESLWSLLLIACLVASVRMVWIMHGRPKGPLQLMGYSFGPALVCVVAGQMGLLVLLGLSCFLRWHRSHPFFAGVSLWLCLLKPHLFLPFGIALLAWTVATRSYRVLAGVALALGASAAVASTVDPPVWTQYIQMLRTDQVDTTPIPCLSMALRRGVDPGASWLQYLPAALGCAWALIYFRKHRHHWDWLEQGSSLMLVSVLVAPYAWITDQAVLIPAILHGVHLSRSRGLLAPLGLASAMIEFGIFLGKHPFRSVYYLWTVPAWFAWYLWAVHSGGGEDPALSKVVLPTPAEEACL